MDIFMRAQIFSAVSPKKFPALRRVYGGAYIQRRKK